jgi:hypothetical protein
MLETLPLHRIPVEMLRSGAFAKLNVPWILTKAKRLVRPVRFEDLHGAVDWVNLPDDIARAVAVELAMEASVDAQEGTVH